MLDFFNTFSGGSLERMSIIALGVMPYITASIVVQLASTLSPSLGRAQEGGREPGARSSTSTRATAPSLLTAVQGYFIAVGLEGLGASQGIAAVVDPGMMFRIGAVISLVGGTLFLMWLGEQITSRGIGNGVSLIIMAGIVAPVAAHASRSCSRAAATGTMDPLHGRRRSSCGAIVPGRCSSASWSARSAAC